MGDTNEEKKKWEETKHTKLRLPESSLEFGNPLKNQLKERFRISRIAEGQEKLSKFFILDTFTTNMAIFINNNHILQNFKGMVKGIIDYLENPSDENANTPALDETKELLNILEKTSDKKLLRYIMEISYYPENDAGLEPLFDEVYHSKKYKYFTLPGTSLTNTTKKILNNPSRINSTKRGQLKKTKNLLTKDSIITYKGNDSTLTFTLERTKELFTKKMQNGAKIFNFLLQKLNEQNRKEITTFQLSEIVNNGIYANKDSAARGLKKVLEKIYAISIEGITTEYNGRKKEEKIFAKSRIVSSFKVSYNECIVSLTPVIRESTRYITILPSWGYLLNENSYMLLDYIFYLARQNAKQIKEKGHFNISLDTIRIHLGLPTIKEAGDHPQQLIINPIEKAITEIEEARSGTDIKITPFYDHDYKNIGEYLSGYLQIELDEAAKNYMEQRAIAQENEYKKEQNRIEKVKQKSTEKSLSKQAQK